MAPEKVTDEQANAALQQLVGGDESEPAAVAEPEPEPSPEPEAAPEPAPEEATQEAQPAEGDDLASLKKRLEEREAQDAEKEKAFQARWQAMQRRAADNERILRERYLRKSTIVDKAARVLKATRSEGGVPEAEVDAVIREIDGSYNPASASYVPPPPQTADREEQAMILNAFLNEKGMTGEDQDKFASWIQMDGANALTPSEQAVALRDIDGYLRIAHSRWQEGMREQNKEAKRTDAVNAVRSVQRTQKEAAKAASASPTAPRKQPVGKQAAVDVKKLTHNDVSKLLHLSVEENE